MLIRYGQNFQNQPILIIVYENCTILKNFPVFVVTHNNVKVKDRGI